MLAWSGRANDARAAPPAPARPIDPVAFRLGASIHRFLTMEAPRLSTADSFRLELVADYASGLMTLRDPSEPVIAHRADLQLNAAYALGRSIELAFSLPVTIDQDSNMGAAEGAAGLGAGGPSSSGVGDLRLLGKIQLLDERRAPIDLGLVVGLQLPTGNAESFMGEVGDSASPRLVAERTLTDSLSLGFEAGYRYRPHSGKYLGLRVGDEVHVGLAARQRLRAIGPIDSWALYGEVLSAAPPNHIFSSKKAGMRSIAIELLAGARAHIGDGWEFTAGGGHGMSVDYGYGSHTFRLFAAVGYMHKNVPEAYTTCPNIDYDRDGIVNADDACPRDPGLARYDGCPDTDGDEIPDPQDECRRSPGPPKNSGCPIDDSPMVLIEKNALVLNGSIQFDYDKETIQAGSMPVVQAVYKILEKNQHLRKVRIEGHTDSLGGPKYNRQLSQRRATEVKRQLVALGIAQGRLIAKGYGEDKPIASNKTALGRARNRRVEFLILDQGPPGAK